jgi:hypothetical protein
MKSEFIREGAIFAGGFAMITAATIASIWAVKQQPRSDVSAISIEGLAPVTAAKLSVRRQRKM